MLTRQGYQLNLQKVKYLTVLVTTMLVAAACSTQSETVAVTSLEESNAEQVTPDTTLDTTPTDGCLDGQTLTTTTGEVNAGMVTGEDVLCETSPSPEPIEPTPAPVSTTTQRQPTESEPIDSPQEPVVEESLEQDTREFEPLIIEKPWHFVDNPYDKSTPMGRLCWALAELSVQLTLKIDELMTEHNPYVEIVYTDVGRGSDDTLGALGIVDGISSDESGHDSFIQGIQSILDLEEVVVNDPELSPGLRLFAEGYFESVSIIETRINDGFIDNLVDHQTQFTYPVFISMYDLLTTSEEIFSSEDVATLLQVESEPCMEDESIASIEEFEAELDAWSYTQGERISEWGDKWGFN